MVSLRQRFREQDRTYTHGVNGVGSDVQKPANAADCDMLERLVPMRRASEFRLVLLLANATDNMCVLIQKRKDLTGRV